MQNNLKAEITKSGMLKSEFAKKSGISTMSLYRYIKGERRPGIDTARRIAEALGQTVDEVFPAKLKQE